MQFHLASFWNRLFGLAILLVVSVLIIGQLANHAAEYPTFPESLLLKTTPPREVAIELTESQNAELEGAFQNGFDSPEPNDPCRRLRLLPFKKLST